VSSPACVPTMKVCEECERGQAFLSTPLPQTRELPPHSLSL
jgi:hypothetical protein